MSVGQAAYRAANQSIQVAEKVTAMKESRAIRSRSQNRDKNQNFGGKPADRCGNDDDLCDVINSAVRL
jgi:hypothetical protein